MSRENTLQWAVCGGILFVKVGDYRMSSDNERIIQANTAIKKTGRGGKYNFPSTVDPSTEDPATIRAVLSDCLKWYELGNRKKAVTDDEIEKRTIEYFQYCLENESRPTVESYCLALGYIRQTVNEWERGIHASPRKTDIIKKAKEFMASFDAGMVAAGKLNPVPYIFRAKNYYGMRDQTDIAIEPKTNISDQDAVQIAQKYNELPE